MLTCTKCRKPIRGKYYMFSSMQDAPFCQECLESERCNVCSRPLFDGEVTEVEGRRICSHCLSELERCSFCDGAILGKHVAYDDGTILCGGCFISARECSLCGRPVERDRIVDVQDKSLCVKCAASLPVCDFHGGPIVGRAFQLNDGKVVCDICLESTPRCHCCGIPVKRHRSLGTVRLCQGCLDELSPCLECGGKTLGLGRISVDGALTCISCLKQDGICRVCGESCGDYTGVLSDGRGFCEACSLTMVESHIRLEEILLSLVSYLERELSVDADPGDDVEITIVDERKMSLLRGSQVPSHTLGRFEWAGDEILGFFPVMPLAAAKAAIAHEYTHFWLENRLELFISNQLAEGFARLVSIEFLKDQGHAEWAAVLEGFTDCFEAGYAECLKGFMRGGLKMAFDLVERHSMLAGERDRDSEEESTSTPEEK